MRPVTVVAIALAASLAYGASEEFQVTSDHPRLMLTRARLRLLKRERERHSMRWQQFEALVSGKANMPEPGFAYALYYKVAEDAEAGRRAVAWALAPGRDLRQSAIVYDWCHDLMDAAQSRALAARLRSAIAQSAPDAGIPAVRARVLAAVAVAGEAPDNSAAALENVVKTWWEGRVVPALKSGRDVLPRGDYYALFELLHAIRDNLNIDLRESVPEYFKEIAMRHLLAYYPATYPAGENDYRIPAARGMAEPDLGRAAFARAADLAIVAFDLNSPGGQVLQGWLMHDRFQLRGTLGAPYEFLWANPYQPGLSYYHVPLVFHDERYGALFVRSTWDENATWFGTVDGELQIFRDGRVTVLNAKSAGKPLELTEALVLFAGASTRFKARLEDEESVFILGLKPRQRYQVEVDDQEMSEETADPGGILAVKLPHKAESAFRIQARAKP